MLVVYRTIAAHLDIELQLTQRHPRITNRRAKIIHKLLESRNDAMVNQLLLIMLRDR